jgi:hypothetical protein
MTSGFAPVEQRHNVARMKRSAIRVLVPPSVHFPRIPLRCIRATYRPFLYRPPAISDLLSAGKALPIETKRTFMFRTSITAYTLVESS